MTNNYEAGDESDRVEAMRRLNAEQREFYECRHATKKEKRDINGGSSNLFTNVWTLLRSKIINAREQIGVTADRRDLHVAWIERENPRAVLDLGCFDGNELSLWMADRADEYLGIDLSESAISDLERKLRENGHDHAQARSVDFLECDFQKNSFDLVYAKSVLHHFEFLEPVLEKLNYILAPGGVVISTDPLKTEPANRLARALYRPFQTDKKWEWPFTRSKVSVLKRYFELEDTQGFLGASRLSLPFFLIPFGQNIARKIGQIGHDLDREKASDPGPYLYNMCWQVSFMMRSRGRNVVSTDIQGSEHHEGS